MTGPSVFSLSRRLFLAGTVGVSAFFGGIGLLLTFGWNLGFWIPFGFLAISPLLFMLGARVSGRDDERWKRTLRWLNLVAVGISWGLVGFVLMVYLRFIR